MDSKQLIPSNSGANRAFLSAAAGRGPRCSAAFPSCCFGACSACRCSCCCFWLPAAEVLHDSWVENPLAEMSAGEELRIEKARILSMVAGS
jgi:hypothetical protein